MGRMKDFMMDLENSIEILEVFTSVLDTDGFRKLVDKDFNLEQFIGYVNHIYDHILFAKSSGKLELELVRFVQTNIDHLNNFARELLQNDTPDFARELFQRELGLSMEQYLTLNNEKNKIPNQVLTENTLEYYENKIKELETREISLNEKFNEASKNTKEEVAQAKLEAEAAKKELEETKRQLDLKKRQEDAKRNWKKNIDETFSELEWYLFPIKDEKDRLNKLFWVYLIASCVLVLVVALIEIIAIVKITKSPAFPDFKQYITLFLPIPIVGAMLWAFIYQMNRAQRQLIVIAKSIHKVEYVQGLLLAINKLAPNVEDGITRINLALDKLVSNHLNEKEVNSEEDIIKEEKKDIVPVDSLIKILKELKGVVGKE